MTSFSKFTIFNQENPFEMSYGKRRPLYFSLDVWMGAVHADVDFWELWMQLFWETTVMRNVCEFYPKCLYLHQTDRTPGQIWPKMSWWNSLPYKIDFIFYKFLHGCKWVSLQIWVLAFWYGGNCRALTSCGLQSQAHKKGHMSHLTSPFRPVSRTQAKAFHM